MLKNLVIMLGAILITNPTFVLAGEENCGPPPTEPKHFCNESPNMGADYRADCLSMYEMVKDEYDYHKQLWDECRKRMNDYSNYEPRWYEKTILVCTTPDTKIYGNDWFRGERVQTGTYSSGINGWVCDDVFVPETTNQYYEYPDYDGSICSAYLGNEIRIEPRLKCDAAKVWVPI